MLWSASQSSRLRFFCLEISMEEMLNPYSPWATMSMKTEYSSKSENFQNFINKMLRIFYKRILFILLLPIK